MARIEGNLSFTEIEMVNLTRAVKKQLKKDKETVQEWKDFGYEHKDEAIWASNAMGEYYEERVDALESILGKLEGVGFK